MTEAGPRGIFHVVDAPFQDGCYFVTDKTLAAAEAELAEYEVRYGIENWGELRRSGLIEELEDHLDSDFDLSLEEYVEAIEAAAGRIPTGTDLLERLAALADVEFVAGEDTEAPSDADWLELLSSNEDVDPMYFVSDVCARATRDDLESVSLGRYVQEQSGELSPVSGDVCTDFVPYEDVEALVLKLRKLGYEVMRTSSGSDES